MSRLDVIEIPGHPGQYARRFVVEMWEAAGSPPINSAGRLKAVQQVAWDASQNGTGSPADDPNRPDVFQLAHVRFVALDVPPIYGPAMRRAGFVMPYDYEKWHFQPPGDVRIYPLVLSIPATAARGATDFDPDQSQEEDDMPLGYYAKGDKSTSVYWINQRTGKRRPVVLGELVAAQDFGKNASTEDGHVTTMPQSVFDAIPKE